MSKSTTDLRREHVVKTADGTVYRVEYVESADRIHLVDLGDTSLNPDRLILPAAELKRIPDPFNQKPPIAGLPDGPRPRCAYCRRLLAMQTNDIRQYRDKTRPNIQSRTFVGWSSKRGLFCTLRCALDFAVAAHHAGYRIKEH
jgi:hypothetical protein